MLLSNSDIVSIANYFSPLISAIAALITAIATVVLAVLTYKYIQEIRSERKFRLMLEYINDLKKNVVEPWIRELDKIKIWETFPYIPTFGEVGVVDGGYGYYKGEDLNVEKHHLFADLRNHLNAELFGKYRSFKDGCKKIWDIHRKIKEKLEEDLKKFENSFVKSDEFFEIHEAINFLIDYLYRKKLSEKGYLKFEGWIVDEAKSDKVGYDYMLGCKVNTKSWYFFHGKNSQKRTRKRKIDFEREIGKLLSNIERKLGRELEEISNLIVKAKKDHEFILNELHKFKNYKIFNI